MTKEITAKEVRALPIGSRVTLHGHDRWGYPTHLVCEVVARREGKGVELRYNTFGGFERMPIRAHAGRVFTVEVSEDG
jgi:hypothetical protein